MAGTAYGNISTDNESLFDAPPPNGTIFDRLNAYGIGWKNYFTDLPQTGIIPSTIEKYPANLARSPSSCRLPDGRLPSVSFVDPEFGALVDIGWPLSALPGIEAITGKLETTGGDEESPQDMSYGEYWAYQTVKAVLESPAWPRTLLIYTYDEHGGYYDHVPPPAAIAPDSIRRRSARATRRAATTSRPARARHRRVAVLEGQRRDEQASTTTPRCWRRSRRSGTSRRSRTGTRTRTTVRTSSTSAARRCWIRRSARSSNPRPGRNGGEP